MSTKQIRVTKTKELETIIDFFKNRYQLLSETEIIKMLVSKAYFEENKKFDMTDPSSKELLFQASKVFGVTEEDDEPDNFSKSN